MSWALFTVIAAAAQTLRNALQRDLTTRLGVGSATYVRFLFGFPFALIFLALMRTMTGESLPSLSPSVWPPVIIAALTQIGATGLMLQAMRSKSFVVTTAYIKTEPVLAALFGLIFLGETLSVPMAIAILIATGGVVMTAWPKSRFPGGGVGALVSGLMAAALFAVSAVFFRAAIHALPTGSFGIRASTIPALGLFFQSLALTLYLALFDRPGLYAILRLWRPSLFAGFMGAAASQFWFLGFALATAGQVRTLALIEVFFARIVSGKMFSEKPAPREAFGLVLIVLGVALLFNS